MKLVAAAKLRRAQDAIVAARPYAHSLAEVTAEVAARARWRVTPAAAATQTRERVAVVVITSDRGLCGGFNSNVCRAAQRWGNDKIQLKEADEISYLVGGPQGSRLLPPAQAIP